MGKKIPQFFCFALFSCSLFFFQIFCEILLFLFQKVEEIEGRMRGMATIVRPSLLCLVLVLLFAPHSNSESSSSTTTSELTQRNLIDDYTSLFPNSMKDSLPDERLLLVFPLLILIAILLCFCFCRRRSPQVFGQISDGKEVELHDLELVQDDEEVPEEEISDSSVRDFEQPSGISQFFDKIEGKGSHDLMDEPLAGGYPLDFGGGPSAYPAASFPSGPGGPGGELVISVDEDEQQQGHPPVLSSSSPSKPLGGGEFSVQFGDFDDQQEGTRDEMGGFEFTERGVGGFEEDPDESIQFGFDDAVNEREGPTSAHSASTTDVSFGFENETGVEDNSSFSSHQTIKYW